MQAKLYDKPIQHGELILDPVRHLPRGGERTTADHIVGADSHAGHDHVLYSKGMQIVVKDDKTYVRVSEAGSIKHLKQTDNHKDLPLPVGIYEVRKKKEFDLFEEVLREVQD